VDDDRALTGPAGFCPRCGRPRSPDVRYCGQCGFDFLSLTPGAGVVVPSEVARGARGSPNLLLIGGVVLLVLASGAVALLLVGGRSPAPATGILSSTPSATSTTTQTPVGNVGPIVIPTISLPPIEVPTMPPPSLAFGGSVTIDLTFTGAFAKTVRGDVPANFVTFCKRDPVPSNPARTFVSNVLINSDDFPGSGTWDLYYTDDDGPGHTPGAVQLTVVRGFDSSLYQWAQGTNSGTVTYDSSYSRLTLNVHAPLLFASTSVTIKGVISCSP